VLLCSWLGSSNLRDDVLIKKRIPHPAFLRTDEQTPIFTYKRDQPPNIFFGKELCMFQEQTKSGAVEVSLSLRVR